MREFLEAATALSFNTGEELFTNFCSILRSTAEDDWDHVIQHIPNCTPVLFHAAIEEWKQEMILPSAQQTMVDYLKTLTKPCKMTVEAFTNRVKVMVRYINNIPFLGPDPPTVSQTKLKSIIFRVMPVIWQTNFLQEHDVLMSSVLQLQQFMSQECEFTEPQNLHGNFNNRHAENPRDSRLSWNLGQSCIVMPGFVIPGRTIVTPRAMRDQRIQQSLTRVDCRMTPSLGPNAGKTQTQPIFKDEYLQDELVISTKVNDTMATTTTMETTTMVPKPVSKL
jgi:hypothetical protein